MCGTEWKLPVGARVVSRLAEAGETERVFVWALRRWLDSDAGRASVGALFRECAGRRGGEALVGLFEAHVSAVAAHCRRRLYGHCGYCDGLGADEAALARVVGLAGDADLCGALDAARPMVVATGWLETVETAMNLGWALSRITPDALRRIERVAPQGRPRDDVQEWGLGRSDTVDSAWA